MRVIKVTMSEDEYTGFEAAAGLVGAPLATWTRMLLRREAREILEKDRQTVPFLPAKAPEPVALAKQTAADKRVADMLEKSRADDMPPFSNGQIRYHNVMFVEQAKHDPKAHKIYQEELELMARKGAARMRDPNPYKSYVEQLNLGLVSPKVWEPLPGEEAEVDDV